MSPVTTKAAKGCPGRVAVLLLPLIMLCLAASGDSGDNGTPSGWLRSMEEMLDANPIPVLFAVIGLGMVLGRLSLFGISLGNGGVIFSAILFGAFGFVVPSGIGSVGLVLFVYCIGITAGPGFFRSFAQQGAQLVKVGLLLVFVGALVALLFSWLMDLPVALAVGIFAGAMTSTPGLAAAVEATGNASEVSVGYGIAYPVGVVAVVLFTQLLPRIKGVTLDEEAQRLGIGRAPERRVHRALIKVTNPNLFGKTISGHEITAALHCQISRISRGDKLAPVSKDTVFEKDAHVLAVGESDKLSSLIEFIGEKSDRKFALDIETERTHVVATASEVLGKSLRDLNLLNRFGVTITRIERNAVTLPPQADTDIQYADRLTVVGEPEGLEQFSNYAGHRARALDETDMISVASGIVLGLLLGVMPVALPGGVRFSLGMSGGPLFVGLLLGHFGRVGPLSGYIPRPARLFMMDMGLVLFLAAAGAQAGDQFLSTLQVYGVMLPVMAALVAIMPMLAGYLFATHVLNLNLLQVLGGICGGMTSTPGLGALTGQTDSDAPALSYATVYPLALIVVTLMAQVLTHVIALL